MMTMQQAQAQPPQPEHRLLARTTAHWLAAAATLRGFHLLVLAATWYLAAQLPGLQAPMVAVAALLPAVWLMVLHLRLAADARLFADLAAGDHTAAELDQALLALGLLRRCPPARSMPQRCAGAMRLWRQLLGLGGVQVVLLLACLLAWAAQR